MKLMAPVEAAGGGVWHSILFSRRFQHAFTLKLPFRLSIMIYNLYSVICVKWGNTPTFCAHVDRLQPPLGPINAVTVEFAA